MHLIMNKRYLLRNFPQEIKDQICVAIDLAINLHVLEITFDENFYVWNK